jgi:hypothetical protein
MKKEKGDGRLYHTEKVLADTNKHPIEDGPVFLKFCVIYCDTQNVYVGDEVEQLFLIEAGSPCDMSKALPLTYIDLSTVYVKAAVSGAILHIVGA